jgi:hypothetical protein
MRYVFLNPEYPRRPNGKIILKWLKHKFVNEVLPPSPRKMTATAAGRKLVTSKSTALISARQDFGASKQTASEYTTTVL